MVDQVSNYAPVAPSKQEATKPAPPREVEREREPASSGRDTVSISKEAQELLAEESRAEESRVEASRAKAHAEEERIDAIRTKDAERKAALRRAETERLRETPDEEPAESAQSEENERTRA